MQEQAIRAKIRERLQSGQLPRELRGAGSPVQIVAGHVPTHTVVRSARGEFCSACDDPIPATEYVTDFVTPVNPKRVFVFHNYCEDLWREESSRFVRRQKDLPPI